MTVQRLTWMLPCVTTFTQWVQRKNWQRNTTNEKRMSLKKHIRNSYQFDNVEWIFKPELIICLLLPAFVFSEMQLWHHRMGVITFPLFCGWIFYVKECSPSWVLFQMCCRCRIYATLENSVMPSGLLRVKLLATQGFDLKFDRIPCVNSTRSSMGIIEQAMDTTLLFKHHPPSHLHLMMRHTLRYHREIKEPKWWWTFL